MKQKERLLNYLKENASIDPLQSWKELGIYRLAAVIHILKKEGYDIDTNKCETFNSFGEKVTFAKYSLKNLGEV